MTSDPISLPAASTKDYSPAMRVWHWANWLLISGQLLTILFLKVIVKTKTAAPEFQAVLGREGISLSEQQARSLTRIISHRIWDWHIYIGLTLAAFWLLRVLLELRGPTSRRFGARLQETLRRYRLMPPARDPQAGKKLFPMLTYLAFYLMLTVIVITGLGLTWADDYDWLHKLEHTLKEIHNVTMYLIIAFFLVHLIGVLWMELTSDKGLVSRMISGGKEPNNQ
jgi:Ni/Fe-hydrogenase 1 B-type cytochrome subunit